MSWLKQKDKEYLSRYIQAHNREALSRDPNEFDIRKLFGIRKGFEVKSALDMSLTGSELKRYEVIHDTIVSKLKSGDEDVNNEVRKLIEDGEELAMTYTLLYSTDSSLKEHAILSLYRFCRTEGVDLITPFIKGAKDVSSTALTDVNIFLSFLNIVEKYAKGTMAIDVEDVSFMVKNMMKIRGGCAVLEPFLSEIIDGIRDPELLAAILNNRGFKDDIRVQAYRYLRLRGMDVVKRVISVNQKDPLLRVINSLLVLKDKSTPRHRVLRALSHVYDNLSILSIYFKKDINVVISRINAFPDNLREVEIKRLCSRISNLWGEVLANFVYADNDEIRKAAIKKILMNEDIIALEVVIDDERFKELDLNVVELIIRMYLRYTEGKE
ncbi:MAG: hypothetical protein ACTSVF_00475 [Candidatus Asgardarchaeia archaeon]